MYNVKIYRLGKVTDYEYTWAGNYGRKGEQRAPKQKPTPREIELNNRIQKSKRIRRLILSNFERGDCWVTLTYPAGTRKRIDEVQNDVSILIRKMRREYRKKGASLKWIKLIEIGKRGGCHAHLLMNRIRGEPDTLDLLDKYWRHGHVNVKMLYDFRGDSNYEQLADYIAKVPEESEKGKRSDKLKEIEVGRNYIFGSSKNLVRPKPEKKTYTRRTMRKILDEGPKVQEGFYIDKSTWRQGINRFTGHSYLYYSEVRMRAEKERESG